MALKASFVCFVDLSAVGSITTADLLIAGISRLGARGSVVVDEQQIE